MAWHLFLCDADRAVHLKNELVVFGAPQPVTAAGAQSILIDAAAFDAACDASGQIPALAFARQVLPAARTLPGSSIGEIARAAAQAIIENCDDLEQWRFHTLRSEGETAPGPNRLKLVRTEIEATLKKRRRRLLKTLCEDSDATGTFALVQLYLESAERAYLSISVIAPKQQPFVWRRCLSPWPGGVWHGSENREPPSRAYRKLEEALTQFPWISSSGIRAREVCVDLGASPGGWSWVALARGARVIAVDRSPLREDLMGHPQLTFIQGDAFRFEPEQPVDWLICDVIAFPERTIELLSKWLEKKWCRNFCVTVKFRGSGDYTVLSELKTMLNKSSRDFAVRRLTENKNEVTAFGCV